MVKNKFFNKEKNSREYSGKLTISFDREKLPDEVIIEYLTLGVVQYEPLPMQCYQCYQLGSKCFEFKEEKMVSKCTEAVPICGWCAEKAHVTKEEKCKKPAKCRNCEGNHPSFSRDCPAYLREKDILYIKEVNNIPYPRAKSIYENKGKPKQSSANKVYAAEKSEIQKLEEIMNHTEREWNKRLNENNRQWQKTLEDTEARLKAQMDQILNQIPEDIKSTLNLQFYESDPVTATGYSEHSVEYMKMLGVQSLAKKSCNIALKKRPGDSLALSDADTSEVSGEDMEIPEDEGTNKGKNGEKRDKEKNKIQLKLKYRKTMDELKQGRIKHN